MPLSSRTNGDTSPNGRTGTAGIHVLGRAGDPRRKSFTLHRRSIDDAARDLDLLDYDFYLFTESGTGQDSVLYRAGATGYRLAQLPHRVRAILRSGQRCRLASPMSVRTR